MSSRYDAVADTYAAAGDNYEGSAVSALLELVGPHPGPRALDLGCGHGPVARELARRGANVTAVDLSRELLERARTAGSDSDPAIDYVHGDASDAALLDGESFNLIVSNFGLSDMDDLEAVCHTVARLLVVGGRFVFSILHPCFAGADRVSGSWPTGRRYYDEGFWLADGDLSTLRREVGANHRMISTYINVLVDSGLSIRKVREPPPELEWAEDRPGASDQPVYMVVETVRV